MNKDIAIGNKIIYQKMHRRERMRHLQKLQDIKTKPSPILLHSQEQSFLKQQTHAPDTEKHLEVQRNNIALFNKIACILNEKPKIQFPKSRSFVKSVDQALFNHEKKMIQLKSKNENFLKRLHKLPPTISNQLFQKERNKNERYLSFIGKTQTDFPSSLNHNDQLFHEQSLDFDISIRHDTEQDEYVFKVKDLLDDRVYTLKMDSEKFREELMNSSMSYEKMVGRLRMEKNGCMNFIEADNKTPLKTK